MKKPADAGYNVVFSGVPPMQQICVLNATISHARAHGGVDILVEGLEPLPINLDKITVADIERVAAWAGDKAVEQPPYGAVGLRLSAGEY
jgi:hypothetical protein